jgi:hypothetical protein
MDAPPLFVDAVNGDLRLQTGSPCIDVGSNAVVPAGMTTDLAGELRTMDGNCDSNAVVDMGAYEYYLVGDLNTTCGVDSNDFALFASHWLQTDCVRPDNCQGADLDRDGAVELADITLLAEHWLEGI